MELLQFSLPTKKGAKNQISYWRGEIADLTGFPFKRILGQTSGWPLSLIKEAYDFVKPWSDKKYGWNTFKKQTNL